MPKHIVNINYYPETRKYSLFSINIDFLHKKLIISFSNISTSFYPVLYYYLS